MVLVFLRAEVESPRYAGEIAARLQGTGYSPSQLISHADLENESQNAVRQTVLAQYRGYGCNSALFTGFPKDASWRRAELKPAELGRLLYAREQNWIQMSDFTRRPSRLVEKMRRGDIPAETGDRVKSILAELKLGKRFPALIIAEGSQEELILIEGHSRASAYVAASLAENIEVFVASSPSMHQWNFY